MVLALGTTAAFADCKEAAPTVSYVGGKFTATVTVCLESCTVATCYLGATLQAARDGSTFDLPAKEFKVGKGSAQVSLSEKVGAGFTAYAVAVWSTKTPCDRAKGSRQGCIDYGYYLGGENDDAPLWGWPVGGWGWGQDEKFAPIGPVRVQVLDAGGGAALVGKARAALEAVAKPVVDGGKAVKPRFQVEVMYRNAGDRQAAWAIVETLKTAGVGIRWDVAPWPEAPEAFVVALGQ
jgi:hypothetical protein